MARIDWKSIGFKILESLESWPRERFPTIRSVWYYLWSALQVISGTERTYKVVDKVMVDLRKRGLIPFGRFEVKRGEDGFASHALNLEWLVKNGIDQVLNLAKEYEYPHLFAQPFLLEVWPEKLGLKPTFEVDCDPYDLKVRSPEGYTPWEFTYRAIQDFEKYFKERTSKHVIILYFGDLDPSGINIYENLKDQLTFFGVDYEIKRVGVTLDQIRDFHLPEAPLDPETLKKIRRDPRYRKYVEKYGEVFCELDAFVSLAFDDFQKILKNEIESLIDKNRLENLKQLNLATRELLEKAIEPEKDRLEKVKNQIIKRIKGGQIYS